MVIVDEAAIKPPRKPYLNEEYLRRLSRSIELAIDAAAAIEAIAKRPEYTLSTKTANHTATDSDYILLIDATSGNLTVTLPNVSSADSGKAYFVKKIDSSSNTVTISGDANIDGSASKVLSSQYDKTHIVTNNTQWYEL